MELVVKRKKHHIHVVVENARCGERKRRNPPREHVQMRKVEREEHLTECTDDETNKLEQLIDVQRAPSFEVAQHN
jgi:hypothetical protein